MIWAIPNYSSHAHPTAPAFPHTHANPNCVAHIGSYVHAGSGRNNYPYSGTHGSTDAYPNAGTHQHNGPCHDSRTCGYTDSGADPFANSRAHSRRLPGDTTYPPMGRGYTWQYRGACSILLVYPVPSRPRPGSQHCRSTPFMPLPPSHVPIVAELIRQGRFRTPHIPLASQLWLLATAALPRAFGDRDTEATEACSIHALKPFPGFPIGDKRASCAPAVSAPNRTKRGNCCSTRNPPILPAAPPCRRLKIGCPVMYSET